ncbi:WhiB family transcriptional regulator [Kitasatospora sp. NBC_00315]|uniref:WhiB family transcriptional regulator n=1 Tax=Kitasatospora sp. NBC_00315 TaxID=2975963 RepID=UPI003255EE4B
MAPTPVRRLTGTITPHLTDRPAVATIADLRTASDGDLRGAACTTADPDLFFPEDGDTWSERRAKMICAGCPVRAMCLAGALDRSEPYGIFGGLSAEERGMPKRKNTDDAARSARPAPAAVEPSAEAVEAMHRVHAFVEELTEQVRRQRAVLDSRREQDRKAAGLATTVHSADDSAGVA